MPSWTLPLLKGNPICGQRLSSANTFPSCEQSSSGRSSPRTVIIRFSCNSASDAARKNSAQSGGTFPGLICLQCFAIVRYQFLCLRCALQGRAHAQHIFPDLGQPIRGQRDNARLNDDQLRNGARHVALADGANFALGLCEEVNHLSSSTIPSGGWPAHVCRERTAVAVRGPNIPSIAPVYGGNSITTSAPVSACWSQPTAGPVEPCFKVGDASR